MKNNNPDVYAAYCYDENIRMSSSSGGVFTILAKYILSLHGVVYGVAMDEDCMGARFIKVTHDRNLSKLRGSKYFQAKMGDTYKSIKEDLEQGKNVLFSGTGCQVSGLKLFLQKDYTNLICVDVLCHGVPSPALWRKYVEYREEQLGEKLSAVNFRFKNRGRVDYFGMKITTTNNKDIFIPRDKDPFMKMFMHDYCLRPSCYNCMAKIIKMADITIGDFWGIETVTPEMCDGKGTSVILVRTEKGKRIFDAVKSHIKTKKVRYDEGIMCNEVEYTSVIRPSERESFFSDLNNFSFGVLKKKYCKKEKKIIILKRFIKRCIKKILPHNTTYKNICGRG